MKHSLLILSLVIFCVLGVSDLSACAVCYGAPETPVVKAMNWAILLMLGMIGGVLGGILAFAFYLRKKSQGIKVPGEQTSPSDLLDMPAMFQQLKFRGQGAPGVEKKLSKTRKGPSSEDDVLSS